MIFILLLHAMLSNFEWTPVRLKYTGGDWYNDPSCLPNLAERIREKFNLSVDPREFSMSILQAYESKAPFVFMTGHGGLVFTTEEKRVLRQYLDEGGFLYIDDDYGFDKDIRRVLEEIFPDRPLEPVSSEHIIYKWPYLFPEGLPKIHLHDAKPPEGWGIEIEGRLSLFYTFESNISDGWADFRVHRDPESVREQAIRMGVNIVCYAMTH